MDFHDEQEKHKAKRLGEIGQLAYERFGLSVQIESNQRRIAEIDTMIAEREAVIQSYTQSQKDFNTYLSVKEDALTMDQIKKGVDDATKI